MGTNALVLSPPDVIPPLFGGDSLRRHLDAGRARDVATREVKIDGLAADIDVPADLEVLSAGGVGGATGRVLGRPASDYQASA
jgi:2-phospho-L-lactate guanylyltransferase